MKLNGRTEQQMSQLVEIAKKFEADLREIDNGLILLYYTEKNDRRNVTLVDIVEDVLKFNSKGSSKDILAASFTYSKAIYGKDFWKGIELKLKEKEKKMHEFKLNDRTHLISDELYNEIIKDSKRIKSFEELGTISGYIREAQGKTSYCSNLSAVETNNDVFKHEKQLRSSSAFAKLTHLMAKANKGKTLDWNDEHSIKYGIVRRKNQLQLESTHIYFNAIAFYSLEVRNQFYDNHKKLIEEYFMIDNQSC